MAEILKPPQVANILGVSQQAVREHMKRGLWDIGDCIPAKKRGKQTVEYNIYRAKLEAHIGRRLEDDELKKSCHHL